MSDVHANLEALLAVLEDARHQGCTHYAFLGDLVGYCADPKACLDILRAMNIPCVKGNHDEWCATDSPLDGLNSSMVKMLRWTRQQLTEDDREWLRSLPQVRKVENFTIVHASLDGPEHWPYVFDTLSAAASMTRQGTQICFFGHTHMALAFVRDTVVRGGTYTKFRVETGKHYLVNPGAVGQPRDNSPKAAYAIYDDDEGSIELRRTTYDWATSQRKIREAGLGG